MTEITIKLSDTPNNTYGKPLGLLDGMIKTVELNKEVKLLLNAGVIEPTVKVQNVPKDVPMKVQKPFTPVKKKVVSRRYF